MMSASKNRLIASVLACTAVLPVVALALVLGIYVAGDKAEPLVKWIAEVRLQWTFGELSLSESAVEHDFDVYFKICDEDVCIRLRTGFLGLGSSMLTSVGDKVVDRHFRERDYDWPPGIPVSDECLPGICRSDFARCLHDLRPLSAFVGGATYDTVPEWWVDFDKGFSPEIEVGFLGGDCFIVASLSDST